MLMVCYGLPQTPCITTESRKRFKVVSFNRKEFLIAVTSAEPTIFHSEIAITDSWGVEARDLLEGSNMTSIRKSRHKP